MAPQDGAGRRALVVGASRGLGLGLAQRLLERDWHVTATVRRPAPGLEALRDAGDLRIETGVDIDDDAAVARLRAALDAEPPYRLVIVNAGVATEAGTPIGRMPREVAGAVFQTNAVSPIRFADRFHPRIAAGGLLVFLSSKLGSVSLNQGGGWGSYRASKAALNTLARSFHGQHSQAAWGIVLMHPGWVRTDLGGRRATLDVATSARGMVAVLEGRLGQRGCVFLDHEGNTVPW